MIDGIGDKPHLTAAEKARMSMDRLKAILAPFQEQASANEANADPASVRAREAHYQEVMARVFAHQARPRRDSRTTIRPLHSEDLEACDLWAGGRIGFEEMRRRLIELRRARKDEADD